MKITVLKSGNYSFHPAYGPVAEFEEGDDFEEGVFSPKDNTLTKQQMEGLVSDKWAKEVESNEEIPGSEDSDTEGSEDSEDSERKTFLEALIVGIKKDGKKKDTLQKWGDENLGVTVSKASSVENMIIKLCEIKEGVE